MGGPVQCADKTLMMNGGGGGDEMRLTVLVRGNVEFGQRLDVGDLQILACGDQHIRREEFLAQLVKIGHRHTRIVNGADGECGRVECVLQLRRIVPRAGEVHHSRDGGHERDHRDHGDQSVIAAFTGKKALQHFQAARKPAGGAECVSRLNYSTTISIKCRLNCKPATESK